MAILSIDRPGKADSKIFSGQPAAIESPITKTSACRAVNSRPFAGVIGAQAHTEPPLARMASRTSRRLSHFLWVKLQPQAFRSGLLAILLVAEPVKNIAGVFEAPKLN